MNALQKYVLTRLISLNGLVSYLMHWGYRQAYLAVSAHNRLIKRLEARLARLTSQDRR